MQTTPFVGGYLQTGVKKASERSNLVRRSIGFRINLTRPAPRWHQRLRDKRQIVYETLSSGRSAEEATPSPRSQWPLPMAEPAHECPDPVASECRFVAVNCQSVCNQQNHCANGNTRRPISDFRIAR
ncbi:hypothetical protein J2802_004451 [Paraburkholderia caribensis]|nr:hypothetical protein [Paraburkholderia caribensis]